MQHLIILSHSLMFQSHILLHHFFIFLHIHGNYCTVNGLVIVAAWSRVERYHKVFVLLKSCLDFCMLFTLDDSRAAGFRFTMIYLELQHDLSSAGKKVWTHDEQCYALVYSWLKCDIVLPIHIPLNYGIFKLTGLMWWQADKSRGNFFSCNRSPSTALLWQPVH